MLTLCKMTQLLKPGLGEQPVHNGDKAQRYNSRPLVSTFSRENGKIKKYKIRITKYVEWMLASKNFIIQISSHMRKWRQQRPWNISTAKRRINLQLHFQKHIIQIAFPEISGFGGDRDLISGAELGKSVLSLCIRMSALDGISAARTGRNPQTGATIQIAASYGVKLTAGSKLKAAAK